MSALGQAFAASFMAAEDRKEAAAEKKEPTRQEQAQTGDALMASTRAAYG